MADRLLDLGGYPEVYADGVGKVEKLAGGNIRLVMFSWRQINNVYQRVICGALVRPSSTLLDCNELREWAKMIDNLPKPPADDVLGLKQQH